MTYDLCIRLHGSATQYLQEEAEESLEFVNYFPKIEYMDKSSSEQTLRKVEIADPEIVLIRIVEEGRLYGKRVALRALSDLDKYGVYVLVTKDTIYVYSGTESAEPARIKGIDVATMILHEEKKGRAEIKHVMQDSASDEEFQMVKFLSQPDNSRSEREEVEKDSARLHRIVVQDSGDGGHLSAKVQEIKERPLTRDMLDRKGTYIMETSHNLYVWYGYRSSMFERYYANRLADKIGENHPNITIHRFFEKGERTLFKERFTSGFYMIEVWRQNDLICLLNRSFEHVHLNP